MNTIRLLYPDYLSGGLETYYFGANLLRYILPENDEQTLYKVAITPPDGEQRAITDGIYAKDEVIAGIKSAKEILAKANPDRIITIGGNCIVSLAPFDYLHGKYPNTGIIWLDAHPDVSTAKDKYPNAHAMVLASLMGKGEQFLTEQMNNAPFKADEILYVGLQPLHDYQAQFLTDAGVNYRIQDKTFLSDEEISNFAKRFDHILVHFDIDVLDENLFHSTYFANKDLVGDGSSGGKMTMEKLSSVLQCIANSSNIAGFTIAEYLPFDEHALHKMFAKLNIFTEK